MRFCNITAHTHTHTQTLIGKISTFSETLWQGRGRKLFRESKSFRKKFSANFFTGRYFPDYPVNNPLIPKRYLSTSSKFIVFKKQTLLQGANTDLFNPSAPKPHNNHTISYFLFPTISFANEPIKSQLTC